MIEILRFAIEKILENVLKYAELHPKHIIICCFIVIALFMFLMLLRNED